MKNILLPTDLSVPSLWPIHQIVDRAEGDKVNVQLIHMLHPPTAITDLLFINENKFYKEVDKNFSDAFQLLKHRYDLFLDRFSLQFVYCNNLRYLNNYLEANHIDEVYLLNDYKYKQPLAQSVDFTDFVRKCKALQLLTFNQENVAAYQNLSVLLTGGQDNKAVRKIKPAVSF